MNSIKQKPFPQNMKMTWLMLSRIKLKISSEVRQRDQYRQESILISIVQGYNCLIYSNVWWHHTCLSVVLIVRGSWLIITLRHISTLSLLHWLCLHNTMLLGVEDSGESSRPLTQHSLQRTEAGVDQSVDITHQSSTPWTETASLSRSTTWGSRRRWRGGLSASQLKRKNNIYRLIYLWNVFPSGWRLSLKRMRRETTWFILQIRK